MLSLLYVAGFGLSAVVLAVWFYKQRRDGGAFFPVLLLMALVAFVIAVVSSEITFDEKLFVLFRDLIVLGFVGLVSKLFLKRFPLFLFGLLLLVVGLRFYYNHFMRFSLVSTTAIEQQNLDTEGELLLELAEGADFAVLTPVLEKYNIRAARAFRPANAEITELDDYFVLDVPNQLTDLEPLQRELRATGVVDWIEGNEVIKVSPMESEPVLNKLDPTYRIDDPGVKHLWSFEAMRMNELYDLLDQNKIKPVKKAVVAILDTGVDSNHEDIKDNFISISKKYNDDPVGHGTHCAGIACAVTNNAKGVASYSRTNEFVRVTSIKVLNSSGMGTQKMIIDGIIEAADHKVDVISMSLGGMSSQSKQKAYEKAVNYANKAGCIVVAAAGNSNRNAKDYAPVNSKGVIGVSAIASDLSRAVFSNSVEDIQYGIAAPGVDIYSTVPGNNYATYSGTSMATPYVAGLLGLMKSIDPKIDTRRAYEILHATGQETKAVQQTGNLIYPAKAIEKLVDKDL